MKRNKFIRRIRDAVAAATNQTWKDDRHIFHAIQSAIELELPRGHVVAVLTRAQAHALANAAEYCLEMADPAGDHADLLGRKGDTLRRAVRALDDRS